MNTSKTCLQLSPRGHPRTLGNASSTLHAQQGDLKSMNALLNKMVHPHDSIMQFLIQYEYIMATRIEKENLEATNGEISDSPLFND
jgi:hypothetical protein